MTDHLLTSIDERWRSTVDGGGRLLAWSTGGRLLVVGADGHTIVDEPHKTTEPMTPDPVDAAWIGEGRVVIADAVLGAVFAGSGPSENNDVLGASRVKSVDGHTVLGGDDVVALFDAARHTSSPRVVGTGIGPCHTLDHIGGSQWAVGGTRGLIVLDAEAGTVEARVDLDGVRASTAAATARRFVVADLGGVLHVLDLDHITPGIELHGSAEPVRHLAVGAAGDLVVAAAQEDLSWWRLDAVGHPTHEPEWVAAHDEPVTALAMGASDLVASGDAGGTVRIWSPLMIDYPVASLALDDEIVAVAWRPGGTTLAVASMSGSVVVCDVTAGALA
ncbi:MAG: WD40 repeat domain-containing protein [Actinomycetota bacterium]